MTKLANLSDCRLFLLTKDANPLHCQGLNLVYMWHPCNLCCSCMADFTRFLCVSARFYFLMFCLLLVYCEWLSVCSACILCSSSLWTVLRHPWYPRLNKVFTYNSFLCVSTICPLGSHWREPDSYARLIATGGQMPPYQNALAIASH